MALVAGFSAILMGVLAHWATLRNHARAMFSATVLGLLVSAGAVLTYLNTAENNPKHLSHFQQIEVFEGIAITSPEIGENTYKIKVRVGSVVDAGEMKPATGEVLLYVSNKTELDIQNGDRVLVSAPPQEITPPRNPEEFDYRGFLKKRGITHRVFIRDPAALKTITQKRSIHTASAYLEQSRNWLESKLKAGVGSGDAFGVSSALILGQKDHLSPRIRAAYSGTGAMHVLAVSGLHVGIIYLILMSLMKPLNKRKWSKWLRLAIIISCLWLYAGITGLSPSVMRAATMFSAVAVAQNIGRKTNIYNTLATAALVLLCFNPYLILEVGFQLSFLAVLGIVIIQPHIYALFVVENWLGNKIWELTSVSVAAQIATFPLGILYFNQFPNYFLLSNLIVIPGAFAILSLGILLMVSSPIPAAFAVVGNLLHATVASMNKLVTMIESLPNAVSTGLYITTLETWLIYGAIAFLIAAITAKKVRWAFPGFALVLVLLGSFTMRLHELKSTRTVVVNQVSGNLCINFIDANTNLLVLDSTLSAEPERLDYHLNAFWAKKGHTTAKIVRMDENYDNASGFIKTGEFISFHGFKLRVSANHKSRDAENLITPPQAEAWVLSGKSVFKKPPSTPVILSSGYKYRELCCDLDFADVYDVRQNGAWVYSFSAKAHN